MHALFTLCFLTPCMIPCTSRVLENYRVPQVLPNYRIPRVLENNRVPQVSPNYRIQRVLENYRVPQVLPNYRVPRELPNYRVPRMLPNYRVPGVLPNDRVPHAEVDGSVTSSCINHHSCDPLIASITTHVTTSHCINHHACDYLSWDQSPLVWLPLIPSITTHVTTSHCINHHACDYLSLYLSPLVRRPLIASITTRVTTSHCINHHSCVYLSLHQSPLVWLPLIASITTNLTKQCPCLTDPAKMSAAVTVSMLHGGLEQTAVHGNKLLGIHKYQAAIIAAGGIQCRAHCTILIQCMVSIVNCNYMIYLTMKIYPTWKLNTPHYKTNYLHILWGILVPPMPAAYQSCVFCYDLELTLCEVCIEL